VIIVPTEKRIDWKKPPIALFSIITINILVFFLYQTLDQHRYQLAVESYYEHGLYETELMSYKTYLAKSNKPRLGNNQVDRDLITMQMLSDKGFAQFLEENGKNTISPDEYTRWKQKRDDVNRFWSKISSEAFGLKPSYLNPLTLISYQFLHGDVMHLFGNLILLLLVGFAAEAALGSLRFTFYYLLSGIGSGLLFSIIELNAGNGAQSLIGASGSLSGVMAIYLVLFRFQKIEFFYWFAIFTGYFRATALMILPIYIAKEVYFYFSNEGSNVAYTAHLGGFITGAILVSATQKFSSTSIDSNYVDNTEPQQDSYLLQLDQLYKHSAQCEFKKAWNELAALKKQYGYNSELLEIQLNLLRAINKDKVAPFLLNKLGQAQNNARIISAQLFYWKRLTDPKKAEVDADKVQTFAYDLLSIQQSDEAEKIYQHLEQIENHQTIAILARKIASYYQQRNQLERSQKYDQKARSLTSSNLEGLN